MSGQLFKSIVEPKIVKMLKASMELGKEVLAKEQKGLPLTRAEREFIDVLAELGSSLMIMEMFGGL